MVKRPLYNHVLKPSATIPSPPGEVVASSNGVSTTKKPYIAPSVSDVEASAPVLSTRIARSALSTLIHYFQDLSAQQPFIKRRLILAVLCIIIAKLIGITIPFLFKAAIDNLMNHANSVPPSVVAPFSSSLMSSSFRIAIAAILLHGMARVAASFSHELRHAVFARAGQRVGRSITATTFAHMHSLELAFHTTSQTGALTRVIDRGTRSVMVIFRAILFSFFPSFFELLLVCAVLFTRFSAAYVGVTIATFLAFTMWTLSVNDKMSRVRAQLNATENDASAKLTDSLINVEAVKVFDNSQFETLRYDTSLAQFETIATYNETLYARLNIGQTLTFTAGLTVLLLLAARDIAIGKLTVGSVVLLSTMLQRLWIPLDFLGWQYREVKQSLIDIQNLFDILSRQSTVKDVEDAKDLDVTRGDIEFDNVSFIYPVSDDSLPFTQKPSSSLSNQPNTTNSPSIQDTGNGVNTESQKKTRRRVAINKLSFKVPAGSSVALVGASGSGKSTATRLLTRLYDVTGGRILVDGQDISKATISSLRQAVSIVPQVCQCCSLVHTIIDLFGGVIHQRLTEIITFYKMYHINMCLLERTTFILIRFDFKGYRLVQW